MVTGFMPQRGRHMQRSCRCAMELVGQAGLCDDMSYIHDTRPTPDASTQTKGRGLLDEQVA